MSLRSPPLKRLREKRKEEDHKMIKMTKYSYTLLVQISTSEGIMDEKVKGKVEVPEGISEEMLFGIVMQNAFRYFEPDEIEEIEVESVFMIENKT